MRRRRFLGALTASVIGAATAGCTGPPQVLSAPPAGLSAAGLEALDLRPVSHQVTRLPVLRRTASPERGADDGTDDGGRADAGRFEFEVHRAVYSTVRAQQGRASLDEDWNDDDPASRVVGVVATPSLSVLDRSPNPLVTRPLGSLAAESAVVDALACAGVGGGRLGWERPPEPAGSPTAATLLGTATRIESFAAVLVGREGIRQSLLVHLSRARRDGTAVLVAAAQRRRLPDGWQGERLVGPDGVLTGSQLDARQAFAVEVDRFTTVTNPVVGDGGATPETPASVATGTPRPLRERGRC